MKVTLTGAQRDFLQLVSQAIIANPFGDHRVELDLEISGRAAGTPPAERLQATIGSVCQFLDNLERDGLTGIAGLGDEDRHLLSSGYLFRTFHEYIEPFDALIVNQIAAGEEPCAVPFADRVIAGLAARGFPRSEALRYLAIFYQLRRAFHFINVSLVGRSACMKDLRLALWSNVFTGDLRLYDRHLWNRMEDFSTLIVGGTGSGKGAAATAIGRSGFIPYDPRTGRFKESFMRSFLEINLSQFPESLIESELFGHRKGAFTGAVEAHHGLLSRCSPFGSIFLDEIGDVSIPIQIKLLKVLEDRTFSPVGSHEKRRFEGRIIAASNRPLQELRSGQAFRDDFFYRLCSDIIAVPSLRQRVGEDANELGDLIEVTVRRIVGESAPDVTATVAAAVARDVAPDYEWPGNVRELEQCVRRILLTGSYKAGTDGVTRSGTDTLSHDIEAGRCTGEELLSRYCQSLYAKLGSYEAVGRRTELDRRTVKKYVLKAAAETPSEE